MSSSTDYVVRSTRRVGLDGVAYTVVDLEGHVVVVTVPRWTSVHDLVDPVIRWVLGQRDQSGKPLR